MVDSPTPFGAQGNPIDNSDATAETVNLDIRRSQSPDAVLYRYINNTDVSVDVTVVATDSTDEAFDESEELRGAGSGSESTLTVASGAADSDLITEPWELLRFGITFASDPTSGEFVLRSMEQN